ncbi:MAG: HAMP domain-containing protein [Planctomycetes bacterium]|nr:HAMP domain-containing protein [Planctomycetota bacterium]
MMPLALLIGATVLAFQINRQRAVFDHVHGEVIQTIRSTESFTADVNLIRAELWRAQAGQEDSLDRLVSAVERADITFATFGHYCDLLTRQEQLPSLAQRLERFKSVTSRIATAHTPELRQHLRGQLIEIVTGLRAESERLLGYVAAHADTVVLSAHRAMNLTILVFLFTFAMAMLISIFITRRVLADVAEPVAALVKGTERLAEGDLTYRVRKPLRNEFGILADSFNTMAERLAHAEQRRVEAVQQTSVTLQHYINNSLAALMGLSARLAKVPLPPEDRYIPATIEEEAKKVSQVIQKLSQLQQIITVEYARGVLMVDPEAALSSSREESQDDGSPEKPEDHEGTSEEERHG